MKTLKTLTFTALPAAQKDPAAARRAKLVAHLESTGSLAKIRCTSAWSSDG